MANLNRKNRGGFSLAEAMMATVVLAIAAAGLLLPFTSGLTVQAEGQHRTLAAKLAADMTEQIVNTPFDQIVATFDGYSEAAGQVKDTQGAVFSDPAYFNFSRDVSCSYVYVLQEAQTAEANFILATVRVYYKGGEVAVVNRLIAK
jgi:type II secretory pathway pseudopilin PulG